MITVCIPTKNRVAFLRRLLGYYAAAEFEGPVFVGDSSDPEAAEATRRLVESLRGRLDVRVWHLPGHSSCACLETLFAEVRTPYGAYVGDDDFLCVEGLRRSAEFLDTHPDYVAAHGKGVIVTVMGDGPHGAIDELYGLRPYPQAAIDASTAAGRLREFFAQGPRSLIYSVHRVETWRQMLDGLQALPGISNSNIFKDELIPTCRSVARGRVKELDVLYLVRQAHQAIWRHPTTFDWITHPAWLPSYGVFLDRVAADVAAQDGLTPGGAADVVRQVFSSYLAAALTDACARPGAPAAALRPSRLREAAKRVPGVRALWRRAVAARQRPSAWSLAALLDPASPHRDAFEAIYRQIVHRPVVMDQSPVAEAMPT
jgi:glycosyltransferase domain-containing protein